MMSIQEGTQVLITHIRQSHPPRTLDGIPPLNFFAEQPILNTWKGSRCQRHCQISEKNVLNCVSYVSSSLTCLTCPWALRSLVPCMSSCLTIPHVYSDLLNYNNNYYNNNINTQHNNNNNNNNTHHNNIATIIIMIMRCLTNIS